MDTCPFNNPKYYLDVSKPCPVCGALGNDVNDVIKKCIDEKEKEKEND